MATAKTKAKAPKKKARGKPGPKPKPPEALVVKKSVSLLPATYEGLLKKGDGSLSRGIEVVYSERVKK
ncbi:hypothetical protein [Ottowia sp.]|uniref:hypothetical protein n=1 Tax=Ottowia sp. TaxID=1898956 RepID=UPI0025FF18C2|nr:hypothetical protein [Ottowia sp.]MBK6616089.1 hypothetical protein [Ottowia sp.]